MDWFVAVSPFATTAIASKAIALSRENLGDRNIEARRIEPQRAVREYARLDDLAGAALVMNRNLPIGVENEIVHDARQQKVARQLGAVVIGCGTRRKDLDHDNRARNLERIRRKTRSTIDERAGLKNGSLVNTDARSVGKRLARQASSLYRGLQRSKNSSFCLQMRHSLRRPRDRRAVMQFPPPFLTLGPGQELVGGELLFG